MKNGYIRVAAATPDAKVADPRFNRERICELIKEGIRLQTKIMVFPELCMTAYTCGDLFLQSALLTAAIKELKEVLKATKGSDLLAFIGMPWEKDGKLYNTAVAIQNGKILGIVPKTNLPNYSEFYELRYFTKGNKETAMVKWGNEWVPMGTDLLFACDSIPGLIVAAEICEDAWVPFPPSTRHACAGATVIVNCSASDETIGKDVYRRNLITGQSASLVCGYVYANAGEGESTQDLVFGGQNLITENGTLLAESSRFENEVIYADMDLERLNHERRRLSTFPGAEREGYTVVTFSVKEEDLKLKRFIDSSPFVPDNERERNKRCEEILSIQAMGLKKRLAHTGIKHAVLGISGGLDSTLALLITVRAFDLLKIPRSQIHAITMPCFGTTDRTYKNACLLTEKLGAALLEINIKEAVNVHFRDIGHEADNHDVTYENSQARERTQILMDLANRFGGLVIGTGDMSELALGWATYNGDHMSMYGVNASVPKTLVRHLVRYYADTCEEEELNGVLLDVLDTPVSPELLPPKDGQIAQKTEDLVGPYELHDFYLYQVLRWGYRPEKVYRMARLAFEGRYENSVLLKWLNVFYRRFFSQQFKRSCMPDGPKVGSVAVSPRGDLRMPSDAVSRLWLEELETL
ncbi:NAD(+) synthase [Clostridium sp. E02]|uniref:NAD(+) synthase n=1 Tax=Clostridium sp. E02 TaxID=2487134 RepID=UPI000F53BF91|nr:NAD(+) synthase [Clostridium sp. E02]